MKKIIYRLIIIILLILIIFLLPTEDIIRRLIIYFTNIDNIYFDILVKISIFLLITFVSELDIINSIEYGKIYEFRTQKFERNPIKYIIIVTLSIEAFITIMLRILDLTKKISISSETWINYISSILGITLTAIGIIITLDKYFKDKEEKESPKLILKIVNQPEKINYYCRLNDTYQGGHNQKVYISLVNKGNANIYSPIFRDNYNSFKQIERLDAENQILYTLAPSGEENENKNNYIVELDIQFEEGMSQKIWKEFELIYNSDNYNEYSTSFSVEFNRGDGSNPNIICGKQMRNYKRILGMG